MMTVADLTDFLVADAQAADPDSPDLTFINAMLTAAKDKMTGGKGEVAPLTEGSVGGKTWARNIRLSALEVAAACRAALDFLNEDGEQAVSGTNLDFSEIGGLG
ncbi:MAG TPA: hypothetical protein VJS88_03685 [Chthoniobacterales bacterium]|nr:hypothetical protein [Chthoniobacterales bacterium]